MRYLNDFDNFSSLNESKERRAERKKEKALELMKKAEDAMNSGNDVKALHLLKRATRNVVNAEDKDPNIDITDISNKLISLKKEIDSNDKVIDNDINKENNIDSGSDDFKTISNNHKVKMYKFDIINKIKVVGDEISNEELQSFLKTLRSYLDEYWDKLVSGHEFPKEYQSPHTEFIINVKRKFGVTVFLYKEHGNDKIKVKFNNRDFSKPENKDIIISEINDVLDSENIKQKVDNNYQQEKDRQIIKNPETPLSNITPITPAQKNNIESVITTLTSKDDYFINSAVSLLVNEKLNIGLENTDEDKIYNFFVTQNSKKTIVAENINSILTFYKKKKSTMNESWDDIVGATKRATQSMRSQESKGVVGDLMWAFNTDAKTLSNDINNDLLKIGNAYQKELNKAISNIAKPKLKEDFDTGSMLSTLLIGGLSLKYLPKLAKFASTKLGGSAVAGAETGATSTVARGGLFGISRMGALLGNPYVWVALAVVAVGASSYYLWNSFDEQQDQLATIFLLMWASGSTEFNKELRANGIIIKAPNIDISKLNNLIKSGDMYNETSVKEEEEKVVYDGDVAIENLFHEIYGDKFLDNRDEILDNIYTCLGMRTVNFAFDVLCNDYPELENYQDEFFKACEKEGYFVMNQDKWDNNQFESKNIKRFDDFK